jgi:hypothetical protein
MLDLETNLETSPEIGPTDTEPELKTGLENETETKPEPDPKTKPGKPKPNFPKPKPKQRNPKYFLVFLLPKATTFTRRGAEKPFSTSEQSHAEHATNSTLFAIGRRSISCDERS